MFKRPLWRRESGASDSSPGVLHIVFDTPSVLPFDTANSKPEMSGNEI